MSLFLIVLVKNRGQSGKMLKKMINRSQLQFKKKDFFGFYFSFAQQNVACLGLAA